MALQVGGVTVINNSKELVGITGADTTTKNALTAAGIGGAGAPNWNPNATPDARLTSSGSWSKPGSVGSNDWVVFYMIGGGGGSGDYGGSWKTGGSGGSAAIFASLGQYLPSSISFTVGAGGSGNSGSAGNKGGDTTCVINGRTYRAHGGTGAYGSLGDWAGTNAKNAYYTLPFGGRNPYDFTVADTLGGDQQFYAASTGSVFGGGAGETVYAGKSRTTSTYAGDGGSGSNSGGVPGGGAGGAHTGSGARGEVRIYYSNL